MAVDEKVLDENMGTAYLAAQQLRDTCNALGVKVFISLATAPTNDLICCNEGDQPARACARVLRAWALLCETLGLDGENALWLQISELRAKKGGLAQAG